MCLGGSVIVLAFAPAFRSNALETCGFNTIASLGVGVSVPYLWSINMQDQPLRVTGRSMGELARVKSREYDLPGVEKEGVLKEDEKRTLTIFRRLYSVVPH